MAVGNCEATNKILNCLWNAFFRSPVIIQLSNGGAAFFAGKGIKNDKQKAAILGSIAGAQHVRLMAKHYGIPVILHSDHCAKKLLEWFDGMIEADEAYFKVGLSMIWLVRLIEAATSILTTGSKYYHNWISLFCIDDKPPWLISTFDLKT